MRSGNSSSGNESDDRRSDQQRQQGRDVAPGSGKASGQGAASAYARFKSEMEERAQHTPAGSPGGRV